MWELSATLSTSAVREQFGTGKAMGKGVRRVQPGQQAAPSQVPAASDGARPTGIERVAATSTATSTIFDAFHGIGGFGIAVAARVGATLVGACDSNQDVRALY